MTTLHELLAELVSICTEEDWEALDGSLVRARDALAGHPAYELPLNVGDFFPTSFRWTTPIVADVAERYAKACVEVALAAQPAQQIADLTTELAAEKAEVFRLQCSHSKLYAEGQELKAAQPEWHLTNHATDHIVQLAQDNTEDIIATYSGKDGRRDWVNVGCWLLPGEEIVHRAIKGKP